MPKDMRLYEEDRCSFAVQNVVRWDARIKEDMTSREDWVPRFPSV